LELSAETVARETAPSAKSATPGKGCIWPGAILIFRIAGLGLILGVIAILEHRLGSGLGLNLAGRLAFRLGPILASRLGEDCRYAEGDDQN
jgi:hypothetical protein